MVRLDAEIVEPFLYRDADGAAAAPQADQEIRLETRVVDIGCQLEGVSQQVVGTDEIARSLLLFLARAELECLARIIGCA